MSARLQVHRGLGTCGSVVTGEPYCDLYPFHSGWCHFPQAGGGMCPTCDHTLSGQCVAYMTADQYADLHRRREIADASKT